ncbi:hypothetical protein MPSI1_000905 [Malassezia psittaci]|uniref:RecQ mediated genome instability protein 1 OB-fold domain-containing protein n=1 Tax=Malassezia psittaci TaxID=1821823 RepID=A0AAF0F8C3_9BASI|nr:hypothetical protein MPSI1_000905 [Malassezia psittaci]
MAVAHFWGQDSALRDAKSMLNVVRMQFLASRLEDSMDAGVIQADNLGKDMLLQLKFVTDVGISAQTLLDTLYTRRKQTPPPAYPRQMLRLELDDGFDGSLVAYEYARIPDLELGETPLGCKIRIKGAKYEGADRITFLTSNQATVLGGAIVELARQGDLILESRLCEQLKLLPQQQITPKATGTESQSNLPSNVAQVAQRPSSPVIDPMDEWDLDAEEALREAESAIIGDMGGTLKPCDTPASSASVNDTKTAPQLTSSTMSGSQLLKQLHSAPPNSSPVSQEDRSAALKLSGSITEHLKIPTKQSPSSSGSRPSQSELIELLSDLESEPIPEYIVLSDSD